MLFVWSMGWRWSEIAGDCVGENVGGFWFVWWILAEDNCLLLPVGKVLSYQVGLRLNKSGLY